MRARGRPRAGAARGAPAPARARPARPRAIRGAGADLPHRAPAPGVMRARDAGTPGPVPAERVGQLSLLRTTPVGEGAAGGVVIYARVSRHDQRAYLDRQVARLTAWAT